MIGSQGEFPDIDLVAPQYPDGSYRWIVANRGEKQEVSGQVGADSLPVALAPDSVTTLRW